MSTSGELIRKRNNHDAGDCTLEEEDERQMISGLGTDLCEVERIRAAVERFGDRFLQRIYTPKEIAYASRKANKYERFAARFAAKEAGMKAIGTGMRGVKWHDFEVSNAPSGKPELKLHGNAAAVAAKLGVKQITLSMTHTASMAMAVVILES